MPDTPGRVRVAELADGYTEREWALIVMRSHTGPTQRCELCGTAVALRESATDPVGVPFPGADPAQEVARIAPVRLATPTRREWVQLVLLREPGFGRTYPVPVVHTPARCREARAMSTLPACTDRNADA